MTQSETGTVSVTVGLLFRGAMRRYLEGKKWSGYEIEWLEQKGWTESQFTIRGPGDRIVAVSADLDRWKRRLEAE